MKAISKTYRHSQLRAALGITGVLMLGACASVPPPTASLQAAHQAISDADRAEAGRYASAELGEARTKLTSANDAVAEKKMMVAERLAVESRAEAELASAKTANVKANSVNDEMKHSTSTLIEEMQRHSGESQ
jgi:diphthamide biosynthesis methyltransferase